MIAARLIAVAALLLGPVAYALGSEKLNVLFVAVDDLRPDTTKVWDLVTHFRTALPDVVTLPQLFKNNGYFVQGMGKIYHGGYDDPPSWSVPWTNARRQQYASPANQAIVQQSKAAAAKEGKKGKALNQAARGPAYESADVPDNTYQDGGVADMAIQTLREIKAKNQPFFLAVGFIKPHL